MSDSPPLKPESQSPRKRGGGRQKLSPYLKLQPYNLYLPLDLIEWLKQQGPEKVRAFLEQWHSNETSKPDHPFDNMAQLRQHIENRLIRLVTDDV